MKRRQGHNITENGSHLSLSVRLFSHFLLLLFLMTEICILVGVFVKNCAIFWGYANSTLSTVFFLLYLFSLERWCPHYKSRYFVYFCAICFNFLLPLSSSKCWVFVHFQNKSSEKECGEKLLENTAHSSSFLNGLSVQFRYSASENAKAYNSHTNCVCVNFRVNSVYWFGWLAGWLVVGLAWAHA